MSMASTVKGKAVAASTSNTSLGVSYNEYVKQRHDFLLRAVLSAFARSNFDECVSHFRCVEEPLLEFVRQLPMDAVIARFPSSRQLLEIIYFRLSVSPSITPNNSPSDDGTTINGLSKDDIRLLHCGVACKEIVNYIADAQQKNEDERAKSHCYALLTSIARLDSASVAMLRRYYCLLENSLNTLGDNVHSCSPNSDGRPTPSWEVLTARLDILRKSAKFCLGKLKSSGSNNITNSSSGILGGSVPLLLANAKATFLQNNNPPMLLPSPLLIGDLTLRDVEDRLMIAVSAFPHLEHLVNDELPAIQLLATQLKTRMDADKRLLLLVNELRPRSRVFSQAPPADGNKGRAGNDRIKIADLLHRYKRAIGQALEWIAPGSLESLVSSQLSESLLSLSLTGEGSDGVSSSIGEYLSPGATVANNGKKHQKSTEGNGINGRHYKHLTGSSTTSSLENNSDVIMLKSSNGRLSPLHRSVSEQLARETVKDVNLIVLTDNNGSDANANRRASCTNETTNVLMGGNSDRSSLSSVPKSPQEATTSVEDISLGDIRPSCLVQRFTSLYTDQRMALLDAMDDLHELNNLEPLKARLILSVVILSFRQAVVKLATVREQSLALTGLKGEVGSEFIASFSAALRRTCGTYALDDLKKTVLGLVLEAVSNFPRLHSLPALHNFVNECVRLAWCLSVQQPTFIIGHSATVFDARVHERFYASTSHSDIIKSYIWPALILGCETGPVICKAVVET